MLGTGGTAGGRSSSSKATTAPHFEESSSERNFLVKGYPNADARLSRPARRHDALGRGPLRRRDGRGALGFGARAASPSRRPPRARAALRRLREPDAPHPRERRHPRRSRTASPSFPSRRSGKSRTAAGRRRRAARSRRSGPRSTRAGSRTRTRSRRKAARAGLAVTARALPALLGLVAAQAGRTFLVVSHKATIRLLLSALLGFDPRFYRDRLDQSPACLNILDFKDPCHARLTLFNDVSHYARGAPGTPTAHLSKWWDATKL